MGVVLKHNERTVMLLRLWDAGKRLTAVRDWSAVSVASVLENKPMAAVASNIPNGALIGQCGRGGDEHSVSVSWQRGRREICIFGRCQPEQS